MLRISYPDFARQCASWHLVLPFNMVRNRHLCRLRSPTAVSCSSGEDVFDLRESLGIVSDTPFEETKRLLTDYFAPQRNVEYEVLVFRQAAQHTDETLDKCNARLRQLSKNCNFHETDREVRSQIIQKCLLSKVREKGLSDTDISLSNLLKGALYIIYKVSILCRRFPAKCSAIVSPALVMHDSVHRRDLRGSG